ncbi:MAG: hypothetical protein JW818_11760 [Pirellulales bacterium]|nr:hypothetical protein [Pirellulales bacterium]
MFRNLTTFILLLAALVIALPASADEQPDNKKEADAIIKMVQDSQRKGNMENDYKAFMSIWTKDARMISARSEKPGKYDFALNYQQIDTRAKVEFRGRPEKGWVKFENAKVTFTGETARLSYRTSVSHEEQLDIVEEIFLLRKTKDGWKAYENRFWPVELHDGSEVIKYNAKTWKALDDQIIKLKEKKDQEELVFTLLDAQRYPEAYAEAKKLTKQEPDNAYGWYMRGCVAMEMALVKDGVASLRKAGELDPNTPVPDFARKIPEEKSPE